MRSGLAKAEYAVGYFTEMGIGCRRDPLEANVWYVRAADQGDERARHRIAAIRAAAEGGTPEHAGGMRNGKERKKKLDGMFDPKRDSTNANGYTDSEKTKPKRFGIF